MGNYGKALEYYQKDLRIREEMLSPDHPDTAMTYNNIGTLAFNNGDYRTSVNHLFKVFSACEKALGETHPNTKMVSHNLLIVSKACQEQDNSLADLDEELVSWFQQQIADGGKDNN